MSTSSFLTPDAKSFDRDVLERDGTVLVEFWAPWCSPCQAMKPLVEAVARERSDENFAVAFVNVDDDPELAQRYGVTSIPALKLFRGGEVVAESLGSQPKQALEAFIDDNAA